MAGYVGLNECLEHSIAGGEGPTYAAFDKVERGGMDYDGGEPQENIGLGGQVAYYRDMVVPVGNATTMLQTTTLLQDVSVPETPVYYYKPDALGELPTVIALIHGGPIDDEDQAREHQNCYLRRVKLSCQRGKPVMVEYEWAALSETEAVTIAALDVATKQTGTPVVWHNADVLIDAGNLSCQSWELELVNEFTPATSEDTKAAGSQRLPEWFDPGVFRANLTATVRTNPGFDLSADFPDVFTFQFTGSNTDSPVLVLDIDCTGGSGFEKDGDPLELVSAGDAVLYQIKGKSVDDLDIVAITFAEAA
jgi:hypothetical protein